MALAADIGQDRLELGALHRLLAERLLRNLHLAELLIGLGGILEEVVDLIKRLGCADLPIGDVRLAEVAFEVLDAGIEGSDALVDKGLNIGAARVNRRLLPLKHLAQRRGLSADALDADPVAAGVEGGLGAERLLGCVVQREVLLDGVDLLLHCGELREEGDGLVEVSANVAVLNHLAAEAHRVVALRKVGGGHVAEPLLERLLEAVEAACQCVLRRAGINDDTAEDKVGLRRVHLLSRVAVDLREGRMPALEVIAQNLSRGGDIKVVELLVGAPALLAAERGGDSRLNRLVDAGQSAGR